MGNWREENIYFSVAFYFLVTITVAAAAAVAVAVAVDVLMLHHIFLFGVLVSESLLKVPLSHGLRFPQ